MDASNYMSPDEVERLVLYTYVYTYIPYLSIHTHAHTRTRAHTLTCMYDMILRPRIPRPHLGCNWSGSHVKSNPLPIELFSSIVLAVRLLLSSYSPLPLPGLIPAPRSSYFRHIPRQPARFLISYRLLSCLLAGNTRDPKIPATTTDSIRLASQTKEKKGEERVDWEILTRPGTSTPL